MSKNLFDKDREALISFLEKELIGPCDGEYEGFYGDSANEIPYERYLMGTLYPQIYSEEEYISEEINSEEISNISSDAEDADDSPMSMVFQRLPASIGMSFYVKDCKEIKISVWGASYKRVDKAFINEQENLLEEKQILKKRLDKYPEFIRIPIATKEKPNNIFLIKNKNETIKVLDNLAEIKSVWRPMKQGYLVTVSLINPLKVMEDNSSIKPETCIYQVGFRCALDQGDFSEYPGLGRLTYDREEEELALQYRHNINYAIGHGCSVNWTDKQTPPQYVETEFMPVQEVKPQEFDNKKDYQELDILSLQFLGNENIHVKELNSQLDLFISSYEKWFSEICEEKIPDDYIDAKKRILMRIEKVINRIKSGISLIKNNKDIRKSFLLANQVILRQMVHGQSKQEGVINPYKKPDYFSSQFKNFAWRPFQLAFQLLILESLVDDKCPDRSTLDLIWFPAGGGKTEAYFAVAAFDLIHRRLIYGDEGAGTAVITRYTLRLLASQQFDRTATFMCSLEMLRREKGSLLGKEIFSLGFYAGQDASPNSYKKAYEKYEAMLEEENPDNPFVLQRCPLCATPIIPKIRSENRKDYGINCTDISFRFNCPSTSCDLHKHIPISVIDEDLYAHPPSFLLGTIDKFARLAWDHRAKNIFCSKKTRAPSLIIQDELHLISGQLGTIAGIYEAAIDVIINSKGIKPKYIAATATIRRSDDQVKKLYGCNVSIFPPAGLSSEDSFFSKISKDAIGRLYVGVMAQGQSPMISLINTSAVLAQSLKDIPNLSETAINSWWTQVIYHNSKRELGRTLSYVDDDIPNRINAIAKTKESRRKLINAQELSANIKTGMPKVLSALNINYPDEDAIDVLPCTNMISVGVDVARLGLMLIYRQPKLTSEYIQASSRVGRNTQYAPGIVVTLYSANAPRDRSHYEGFKSFHKSLYRFVEPTSVTPFSPRARERALNAALVIVMRHAGGLSENEEVQGFDSQDKNIKELIEKLTKRMSSAEAQEENGIKDDLNNLIDDWKQRIIRDGKLLRFSGAGKGFKSLLVRYGDKDAIDNDKWATLDSMRNVDTEALIKILGRGD